MDQLELPSDVNWSERRFWFEELEARYSQSGAPAPGEQACALMIDLQAVFCAGAWAAVVILAAAIVQSQVKEAGGSLDYMDPEELAWLHKLRNRLVHGDKRKPGLTIQDQWLKRPEWEEHARHAVEITFHALYPQRDLSEEGWSSVISVIGGDDEAGARSNFR